MNSIVKLWLSTVQEKENYYFMTEVNFDIALEKGTNDGSLIKKSLASHGYVF